MSVHENEWGVITTLEDGELNYSNCKKCEHGRSHEKLSTVFCLYSDEFVDGDCELKNSEACDVYEEVY